MVKMFYKLINEHEHVIKLLLEPWAEEYDISPGSTLPLEITAECLGVMTTEINASYFVISLWRTCTARVFINDVEQNPFCLTPVPL